MERKTVSRIMVALIVVNVISFAALGSVAQVSSDGDPFVDWWPMFRHDLRHSGYSTSEAPNTNKTLWSYTTGLYVFSSPAVADGKVYIGSDDNKVYALNATTGDYIWSYTTGDSVYSSPAVADGKVYIGSIDKNVYAFGPAPPVVPQVWSTDSLGNAKSTFLPGEEVYVKGSGFPASDSVRIYIIPNGKLPTPENSVASATATTDASGGLPNTPVWSPPLTLGQYDIWVDVNQNDIFDTGDALNNEAIDIYAFNVIPEVPFGTAMACLSMIVALVGFAGFRCFRPKLQPQ